LGEDVETTRNTGYFDVFEFEFFFGEVTRYPGHQHDLVTGTPIPRSTDKRDLARELDGIEDAEDFLEGSSIRDLVVNTAADDAVRV